MTTEEDEEDLCVVGTVVKAITLWGQKCQSSSRRTIPQLLEISENCSNCYRKNSLHIVNLGAHVFSKGGWVKKVSKPNDAQ